MEKNELKKIYFDFYDELPEPYRSQAKENWNYEKAKTSPTPENLNKALSSGFVWYETKQGSEYWFNAYSEEYSPQPTTDQLIQQLKDRLGPLTIVFEKNEPKRWRPENGESYWIAGVDGISTHHYVNDRYDKKWGDANVICENKDQASRLQKAIRVAIDQFWKEETK